jgi:hypothetical protein
MTGPLGTAIARDGRTSSIRSDRPVRRSSIADKFGVVGSQTLSRYGVGVGFPFPGSFFLPCGSGAGVLISGVGFGVDTGGGFGVAISRGVAFTSGVGFGVDTGGGFGVAISRGVAFTSGVGFGVTRFVGS